MGFTELIQAAASAANGQYYLRYRELKDLIVEMEADETAFRGRLLSRDLMNDDTSVGTFQALLQEELKKVNQFACTKHEDLFLSLRQICEEGRSLTQRSPAIGDSEIRNMSKRIEKMGEEIMHLDTFVRLNYLGFKKVTEKLDRRLGISSSALFTASLHCEPFCNVRFDDILILLGLAWARWRAAQSAEQSKDATWKPPESFIRNTAKYWVRPDKVVLLKSRILRHLPYLIFGASQVDQEKLLDPFALLELDYAGLESAQSANQAYSGALEESQLLSSVYFDSPDAKCYQERIKREEGARLVRFRWYGENALEPDKEIYVERKVHHEGWGKESSAKERCIVPQKCIFDYMKGKLDIEDYFARLAAGGVYSEKARKSMKSIAHEVHQMIQGKQLQPILRTSYYRCAFQLATSNEVRISLDTQMTLLNEFLADGHVSEPWCHISSDLLQESEVYRFPFAILEIKLQDVSETPLWLRQTLADIEAIQVHKFSKFQHGMAFLHPEKTPILPHWHEDFRKWHADKAVRTQLLENRLTTASIESGEDYTVPMVRATIAPAGEGHHLKDMETIDPKAIFANERTLLHYIEQAVYVGGLGVAFLYQGWPTALAGGCLVVGDAVFALWALYGYFSRLHRITTKTAVAKSTFLRLDWAQGPRIIFLLVGFVVVLSLVNGVRNAQRLKW